MRSTTSIRVLLFIALVCIPSLAVAQRTRPTGQSTISGRVLFADNGRPVRRATVHLLTNLNHPAERTTPANNRGEFRFSEVAAGSYFVVAEAPGLIHPMSSFAVTEFGLSTTNLDADQTRVTVDGKNTTRCEVRALRAGTIKGTMTYVDKEPVVNARVVLFRRKGGTVTPFFSEPVMTNDRGMYRIDGLPEGEYFVSLSAGRKSANTPDPRGLSGVPMAYYPGVRSITEAKPIQVQAGTEVTGINLTIPDEELRQISGVVKWKSSGEVVPGAAVTLRRKDEPTVEASIPRMLRAITPPDAGNDDFLMRDMGLLIMMFPPTLDAGSDGKFVFEDLPPGAYLLAAYATLQAKKPAKAEQQPDVDDGGPEMMWNLDRNIVKREVEITINDEDRNDVTLELSDGGRILGSIVMADGSSLPKISILVDQASGFDSILGQPRSNNPDGTFLIEAVPAGEVWLDTEAPRTDLYLKSITLGSQDLMREPLRVTEGGEVAGVRVTLGKGLATLTGRVRYKEDGAPVGGGGVLLVKADPKLWHLRSSRCFGNTDATGEFEVVCAPGDYLAFTWPPGGQPLQEIEDFIRAQASTARAVSLQSKESKQIELTVSRPRK
ncbi:MAG TPA: carboxypeptidase-like regulatory domain-containing protein [Pyrinomonadaceae bacterium]|nr:carboxypeptidase-like regulatory domain-containing protein [Pyrinomonadaceae bacterium]